MYMMLTLMVEGSWRVGERMPMWQYVLFVVDYNFMLHYCQMEIY